MTVKNTQTKLIILDRDGVINQDSNNYIKSVDEWTPIPHSLEAISRLNQHGIKVAIATNQSGIARGYYSERTLHDMHEKMAQLLKPLNGWVDAIFYCPHGPDDNCLCRKPKPGLYQQIAEKFDVSLKGITVIGDSYRDLEAAMVVDAKPVLVRTGKGLITEQTHKKDLLHKNIPIFNNLDDAVNHYLSHHSL